MDPGADAAAGVLESRAQLAYHQCIGNKVQCKHEYPAENNLYSVKVYEAVQYVSEAPYGGERHECQGIPADLL